MYASCVWEETYRQNKIKETSKLVMMNFLGKGGGGLLTSTVHSLNEVFKAYLESFFFNFQKS